jgi:LysR family glycine cleavage system transcriptional activator
LVPRLAAFYRDNSDIDVRLSTTWRVVDFGKEDVDLAIRYGQGAWPECSAELLLKEHLFPVCSPNLIASGRKPVGAADLFQYRLLHNMDFTDWERWADAAGVASPVFSSDTVYDDYNIVLQAAIDGHGIAIGRSALVGRDISAGRLVTPSKVKVESERAYYIVRPTHGTRTRALDRFTDWLRQEAAAALDGA